MTSFSQPLPLLRPRALCAAMAVEFVCGFLILVGVHALVGSRSLTGMFAPFVPGWLLGWFPVAALFLIWRGRARRLPHRPWMAVAAVRTLLPVFAPWLLTEFASSPDILVAGRLAELGFFFISSVLAGLLWALPGALVYRATWEAERDDRTRKARKTVGADG